MAAVITLWVDIKAGRLKTGDCSLSVSDSTTLKGWTPKRIFKEGDYEDPEEVAVRQDMARHHMRLFMEHEIKEYIQWFPGRHNDVLDALSRDDDRSDKDLTNIFYSCAPLADSNSFQNSSTAQRNQLLADLAAAETICQDTAARKTHKDQAWVWGRWEQWCESVGLIENVFFEGFSRNQHIRLLGAFAMVLCREQCSRQAYDTLAADTIRGAISYVAQTFQDNDLPDPSKDKDGKLGRLLSCKLRVHKNQDPPPAQQKALSII
eukprot:4195678-Ditylum_brightwellii.AAC.1